MATMRAMQIAEKGGDFELVEREVPSPGRGEVLVRVHACGVCHSDMLAKEGAFPGVPFPIVPGHEVAGEIAALGEGVEGWEQGQRVGVGWFGGNCGWCEQCRRGDFIACHNMGIPGVTFDGGYADYVLVKSEALAAIPDDLADEDAAPLLCAGITTFNALRESGATGGDLVAILGVGGLGHLGVQFAAKLGFRTVAIARGTDKEQLARELGAHEYIDSTAGDPAEALQALGGAKVILSTISSGTANSEVIGGLGPRGKLIVVGASPDAVQAPPFALIGGNLAVEGHASGTSMDSQDTLAFSSLAGVRPRIETMPLERAQEAYDKMIAGDARFRMVLTTGA
jgi:D-arabinose 1-dehydrogenase-like Zn-dependent alcohol dehydrogenase